MTITRHLDDSTLMSFAAGSLPGALAAVAAAHVAMCPRCRDEVAHAGARGRRAARRPAGGADGPSRTGHAGHRRAVRLRAAAAASDEVPAPLARLVGGNLDAVRWRWIAPGLWQRPLPIARAGQPASAQGLVRA